MLLAEAQESFGEEVTSQPGLGRTQENWLGRGSERALEKESSVKLLRGRGMCTESREGATASEAQVSAEVGKGAVLSRL